ncbi:hypothetical protein LCGC14_1694590 [marine sediment metagenome]|uniref:Uncharacterized protein n=1 Tax=marine sediment metagenome TaxID=412755 RepID=A0A0F9KJX8_9ZZZZ
MPAWSATGKGQAVQLAENLAPGKVGETTFEVK